MKMITGFLAPTAGTAIDGDLRPRCRHGHGRARAVKRRRLPARGRPRLPRHDARAAFLDFIAPDPRHPRRAGPRRGSIRRRRARPASGVLRQPIETLSKGFKRRVGLAQAILHDPEVLILDEPTDGLDPNQKHEVRNLIREMAREGDRPRTHILEEVEAVCTRAIIIARGRIVADKTPAELQAMSRSTTPCACASHGARARSSTSCWQAIASVSATSSARADDNGHIACSSPSPRNGGRSSPRSAARSSRRASRGRWAVGGARAPRRGLPNR
jgi:ABC-2 type transport system ATP-binding protein